MYYLHNLLGNVIFGFRREKSLIVAKDMSSYVFINPFSIIDFLGVIDMYMRFWLNTLLVTDSQNKEKLEQAVMLICSFNR